MGDLLELQEVDIMFTMQKNTNNLAESRKTYVMFRNNWLSYWVDPEPSREGVFRNALLAPPGLRFDLEIWIAGSVHTMSYV